MNAGQAQRQRERWRNTSILIGALALAVAFGIQLILLVPTTYTATSAIALRPRAAEVPADTIEMQAHEYGVALGADETAEEVQRAKAAGADQAEVSVTTTQDPGTSTVRIAVTSTDKSTAVDVANGLADHAGEIGTDDTTAQVVVVIEAGNAGVTSAPPRNLYFAALVCVAGLLLTGGLYQIRERTS